MRYLRQVTDYKGLMLKLKLCARLYRIKIIKMQIKEKYSVYMTDKFEIDESLVFKVHCFFAAKNLESINNG